MEGTGKLVRVRKHEEHSAKRNQILDTALQLIYAKGYEKMTIQDILDQLQISKGAFYHYFHSKAEVLEAVVERMAVEQVVPALEAAVRDPKLTALEKLRRYFDTGLQWKSAQRELMMQLLRVWYSDDNALPRQKMYALMVEHATPLFDEMIQQGVREGTFTTPYPEHVNQVTINLMQALGDKFAQMLLREGADPDENLWRAEALVAAYTDAIERVLGAPKGSLPLMDEEALKEWFPPGERRGSSEEAAAKVGATKS